MIYTSSSFAHYLAAPKHVWDSQLVPQDLEVDVSTYDTKTGKIYQSSIIGPIQQDWGTEEYTLQNYFFEDHHCQCHRANDCGLDDDFFECEGRRFQILKISSKVYPEIILYSEMLSLDYLNSLIPLYKI